jgi:hypothetical protein
MLLLIATAAVAHDLFIKPDVFFVRPHRPIGMTAFNGTFTTSEAAVTRDRLRDLSIVSSAGRVQADTAKWSPTGQRTRWVITAADAATYTLGASLHPRIIALAAKDFNAYLADDGLPDILAARTAAGELAKPARERYSKHVKTLVQVGEARTASFGATLGYPAELVALDNPYELAKGAHVLRVKALVDGAPIANQVVLAGGRTPNGGRLAIQTSRTNSDGVVSIDVAKRGVWYVKFIRMVPIPASARDSVDYESKWATLTFAIR